MSFDPNQQPADLSSALLSAFQSRFAIGPSPDATTTAIPTETRVLDSASYVADQAIDVHISREGLLSAASRLSASIARTPLSIKAWGDHELHPSPGEWSDDETVRFVFLMDLLNFSFWEEGRDGTESFEVEYRGRTWKGYWGFVACLRRAMEDGVPVTEPAFWSSGRCGMETLGYVFSRAKERRAPGWMRGVVGMRGSEVSAGVSQDTPVDGVSGMEDEMHSTESNENALDEGQGTANGKEADVEMRDSGSAAHEPLEMPPPDALEAEKQAESRAQEANARGKEDVREEKIIDDYVDDDEVHEANKPVIPMLRERLQCLKEAAAVLSEKYDNDAANLIKAADRSAGRLVNLLTRDFACFDDKHVYEGYKVRFYKRAQIFAADVWACFRGRALTPGEFADIDGITAFADYRIPQMLYTMGVLSYSPPVDAKIRRRESIASGSSWEVQLRGCSVWAVELLRREIVAQLDAARGLEEVVDGDAQSRASIPVNAILLDFHLYDNMKALEAEANAEREQSKAEGAILTNEMIPHHRTRSIWY